VNCDEVRDLIAAYSLGTATPEERRAVEEHVESCDLHEEMAEIQATALGLALAAPEMEPPATLRGRIMQAAGEGGITARRLRMPRWLAGGYSIAAVLAIAVIGLAAWNIVLQVDDGGADENFVHFYREGDGDWLRIETVLGLPHATVSLGGLDHLEPGFEYQLWAVRGEQAISLGVFNTNTEGRWAGEFEFAFFSGDRVSITIEQAGGSDKPTIDAAVVNTRF
jgi:anti-sigma-K factor RskA